MSVSEQIKRIKNNIKNAFNALAEKGAILPNVLNSDNLETTINSLGLGADDLKKYESISDSILGSQELYDENIEKAISISNTLDEIICQENTSSVYEEIELDTINNFELIANEIIGE